MWKIERVISKGSYNYAIVKNHPKATKYGYVLEHRVVIENKLKRLLVEDEVVHHKDGNKKNNCVDNLEVMTNTEHSRMHSTKGRAYVTLICPNCGKSFDKEKRQIHGQKQSFCSRKCNGQYYSAKYR